MPSDRPDLFETPEGEPAVAIPNTFTYQSYFDSTLKQKALLTQVINDAIVASTLREERTAGYGVGLHPSSQTPVAVRFRGSKGGHSAPHIVKPGEVVWPGHHFSGFAWGLPFGWLGGGSATVVVFKTPSSKVYWAGNQEIIFHRQRVQIQADGGALPSSVTNWPTRFPWPDAIRGSSSVSQAGSPIISVEPTRTILRLRVSTLSAPASMRMTWRGSLDFDQSSAGQVTTTDASFIDVTWPAVTAGPLGEVVAAPAFPVLQLSGPDARLGCEGGGLVLTDNNNASLTSAFVDIVRYGRL